MRKMISSNVVNKLAVKDGKIGTYVESYSIEFYNRDPKAYPGGNIVLVDGITELGSEWEQAAVPADAGEGQLVFATTYFGDDIGFKGYIAKINGENYWMGSTIPSVPGTFNGENIVIHTENVIDEKIGITKTFKAFKLED